MVYGTYLMRVGTRSASEETAMESIEKAEGPMISRSETRLSKMAPTAHAPRERRRELGEYSTATLAL